MAVLQAAGIADVAISSLPELGRGKLTDAMSDYQNTIAVKRIFKKHKATLTSGPSVRFNLITDENHSARHVGLAYVTNVNIPNVLAYGEMPWRYTHWNWGVERRILQMNSGVSKIVDEVKKNRIAGIGSGIILMEKTLWRCPTLTEFDTNPVGIPYYVVKSTTNALTDTTNDGFNGTVPTSYTTIAGINPTTGANGRWKNYADQYTTVSKDDLIRRMRKAQDRTDFMPLVDEIPEYNTGDDYGIYTNYNVHSSMVEILESQNENLGRDVASMDGGGVMFMGTTITKVKQLQYDTTGPVYMLNWGEIGAQGLSGEWMREEHFEKNPNQPTVSFTVVDCAWNLMCRNRRRQAVLSTAATMPDGAAGS